MVRMAVHGEGHESDAVRAEGDEDEDEWLA